ncbi:DUF6520 family protein [Niabella drilacis]|uniref:Secreted protein n=1 Tax=Niabella drilacis (strain DSM 25811 / CCM 8410 / CCUG 62505 / LMG 26954 / E90) TaxID=1285928 RepID=A0A1G6PJ95_NIADE|nr:DUF6520 family protein [Niabella drilacis]SDC79487.1 hypothetical protein SAMN04487894_10436 [Niabella drilacis]
MNTKRSHKTIKFILPILALAFAVGIAFAFTGTQTPVKTKLLDATLHFNYTAPGGDYSPAAVRTRANWTVTTAPNCETNFDNDACSFSITVPDADKNSYLSGSNPSLKASIQTSGTSTDAYVTNIVDSTLSTPLDLTSTISNKLQP